MSPKSRGVMIGLEGLDKSGKQVQTRLLVNRLEKEGFQVKSMAFPDYSTPIGREIRAFLYRERRYSIEVGHMLLALNRWEKKELLEEWIRQGKIVVLNRYCQSNLAYGLARGLDREWLLNLEKELPKADLVIVLDISAETSLKRSSYDRDVNEGDFEYMKKVREIYLRLAEEYGWKIVDGERSIEGVHGEVWNIVKNFLSTTL